MSETRRDGDKDIVAEGDTEEIGSDNMVIYTIGYSGRKIEEIKNIVNDVDAFLVDIRFSAGSRVATWRKSNFESVFGDKYLHLKCLGNKNYRGNTIIIDNIELGAIRVKNILRVKPVILMCACKNYATCHRMNAAEMLAERIGSVDIVHIGDSFPAKEAVTQLQLSFVLV